MIDPTGRIRRLEAEVSRLKAELEAAKAAPGEPHSHVPQLVEEIRREMTEALQPEQIDALEARVGGVWLGRLAVLLIMTAIVFAGLRGDADSTLTAWQRLAAGLCLAGACIGYGMLTRGHANMFAQTVLGAGLAVLYFAIYAAFFVPGLKIFDNTIAALLGLLACLTLLLAVIHLRRSQTAAGIALFLIYYTVAVSCVFSPTVATLYYALITSAVVAVSALYFLALHRWQTFTWMSCLASYAIYALFFRDYPDGLPVTRLEHFWLTFAFLGLAYLMYALGALVLAHRTDWFRGAPVRLALLNSALFFPLVWGPIESTYPERVWAFRAGFAAVLGAMTVLAETGRNRRNDLFQVFLLKTIVLTALAIYAFFALDKAWVALALLCFLLAFTWRHTGVVVLKMLNLVLLTAVVIGALVATRLVGDTTFMGMAWPSAVFSTGGAAIVLLSVAWYYERTGPQAATDLRRLSGHWFLAGSRLDLASGTLAALHAIAGAMLLLVLGMSRWGGDSSLPYLLTATASFVALCGFVARAQSIEASAIIVLTGGHVAYYFFWMIDKPGLLSPSHTLPMNALMAFVTFAAAWRWEHYLWRLEGLKSPSHHLTAALPYMLGLVLLELTLDWTIPAHTGYLAQTGLGFVFITWGAVRRLPSLKSAGLAGMAFGTGTYLHRLYGEDSILVHHPRSTLYAGLLIAMYILGERVLHWLERRTPDRTRYEDAIRSAMAAAAGAVGVLSLQASIRPSMLALSLIGFAVAMLALGIVVRESRYRWAALLVFAFAVLRALGYDLERPSAAPLATFAAMGVVLLAVSYAYSRHWLRSRRAAQASRGKRE